MPKTSQRIVSRAFEAYLLLNEPAKKQMRLDFHKEFDYELANNSNTFYRKMHAPEQMWNHEKKWVASYLKTSVNKLFGKEVKK